VRCQSWYEIASALENLTAGACSSPTVPPIDETMFIRALSLLVAAIALSWAATVYFGADVLIALGLILTQTKVIAKKLMQIEIASILAWLKVQGSVFLKIELIKKWIMTTVLPLVVGSAVLRKIARFIGRYREAIQIRYAAMMGWYSGLHPTEKTLAALIILFATIALSVTSLGLWLILFSVKLPIWLAAAAAAFWRMVWLSVQKMTFKAVAFLQLSLVWRGMTRLLPASWLERKRRFDYRVARAVIRRRRMTIRQLAEKKDSLPFRLGLLIDYLRGPDRG